MVRVFSTVLLATLIISYPFLVYGGLMYFQARFLALFLLLLAIVRFALMRPVQTDEGEVRPAVPRSLPVIASLALMIVLAFLVTVSNDERILRFYPVCMNALFFLLFYASWLRRPTIIEQIAKLNTPTLPASGVDYTAKVTLVWCGFFLLNGGIALFTSLWASLEFWTLYNGFISYLLMAILFTVEYLFRLNARKNESHM